MPTKKKTVKNAYYFFMEKYREDRNKKNPGNPITIKEAASLCSPIWQNMSPEQKKVYEDIAKKEKMRIRGMPELKYTTTGLTVSEVEKQERELQEKIRLMKEAIRSTVESLDEENILNQPFYFIHANYFCECDDGDYIPAEVGISRFTLRNGIEDFYHSMINPGDLPIGYTYKAKKHSEDTHGIPIPPTDLGEVNFAKLFRDILIFVTPDGGREDIPPLYSVNEFEPAVTNLLGKLCSATGRDNMFQVFDLVQLFYNLRNRVATLTGTDGFPVFFLAETEIENDSYAYTKEICCYWHEGSEAPQYCSLSRARRWGFHIANHCCRDLSVTLVPGQHLPVTDKYFADQPVEAFQTHWNERSPPSQPPMSPWMDVASSSSSTQANYSPLRQPRSMGVAMGQAVSRNKAPSEEEYPPLGKRIGANFGKKC